MRRKDGWGQVDIDRYARILRAEGTLLADAIGEDLTLPVPSCPGWTIADVLRHLGLSVLWLSQLFDEKSLEPPVPLDPDIAPLDGELVFWLGAGISELLHSMGGIDASDAAWASVGGQGAGFWARRVAMDLTIHRWDVQSVLGSPLPVHTVVAVDGIEEYFTTLIPTLGPIVRTDPQGGKALFHATDLHERLLPCWFVCLENGVFSVKRVGSGPSAPAADVLLSGKASDILLLLWGRLGTQNLEIQGDAGLVRKWQRKARF